MKTTNKKLIRIALSILLGFLPILFIYLDYYSEESKNSGFSRKFQQDNWTISSIHNLKYAGYYFSGKNENSIFLGHYEAAAHLLQYNFVEDTIFQLNFEVSLDKYTDLQPNGFQTQVIFPYFYLIQNASNSIIQLDLNNRKEQKSVYKEIKQSFDQALIIDSSKIVVRTYDQNASQNILELDSNSVKKIQTYTPEKQFDGLFGIDGQLIQNKDKVIYLFYYRNEFLVFNKLLQLQYKGSTIDPLSHSNLEFEFINEGRQKTFSKPPTRINKSAFIDKYYLYVISPRKADNETFTKFSNSWVVDQYNLKSGQYIHSFYIPEYQNERAIDINILNNKIFALYNDQLIIFEHQ